MATPRYKFPKLWFKFLVVATGVLAALHASAERAHSDCYENYQKGEYGDAYAACVTQAESGDMKAVWLLSRMTNFGEGVDSDIDEAVSLARHAAEGGYANAQFDVASYYEFGEGVIQSYEEAMTWYRKAAKQGHSGAMFEIGTMYDDAQGVTEDHHAAFRWYRAAAEKGHTEAQWYLAIMFSEGEAVQQSYEQAYLWSSVARRNGHFTAKYTVDDAANQLSTETQANVRRVVERCLNTNYVDCGL